MRLSLVMAIAAAHLCVSCEKSEETPSTTTDADNAKVSDTEAAPADQSPPGSTPTSDDPVDMSDPSKAIVPYDGPTFAGPTKGSATALSTDGYTGLVANRDAGSVSVITLDYAQGAATPAAAHVQELPIAIDAEPWQVAISPAGDLGYVIARKAQRLIRIDGLSGTPKLGEQVAVGSEPTALVLSPTGRFAYVANWNDGTISVVDTTTLSVAHTIDLNPALVATGYLSDVTARPALAHPRALALSNDGDSDDSDETLYAVEYFGQQAIEEAATGENADRLKVGVVYATTLTSGETRTIALSPLADMGFPDKDGAVAGCFPNQLQDIAIHDGYAYVISVCASPKGPVFPRTNTAPLLSVIDLAAGKEVAPATQSFNKLFMDFYDTLALPDDESRRLPLHANSLAFVPGTRVGYVSAGGADAVFRFEVDEEGVVAAVGASTNPFINLAPRGQRPVGLAISPGFNKTALVVTDVGRVATLIDFNTQAIAEGDDGPLVVESTELPAAGSEEEAIRKGKRFFTTGLARWSLLGQAWGACESCHGDGLSDNVTWYFPAGPRQSVAMDGTFDSSDPSDQRILNWTSVRDEVHDFELNTRNVAGGVGAGVFVLSSPPQNSDRIDLQAIGADNLNGSAKDAMDRDNPLQFDIPPQLDDWKEIEAWVQTIRTPRAPTGLDEGLIERGADIFQHGACDGCHSGNKWTISQRFYTPSVEQNEALASSAFTVPPGFPSAILPALDAANQLLRFRNAELAVNQIQCVNRQVGTFGVAEPGVGIAELRQDMATKAQGDGDGRNGRGFNVPSLLGVAAGAPYFHSGGARTLEAALSETFATHTRALSPNLLTETDPAARQAQVEALVAYLLYIDEDAVPPALPMPGAAGGQICPAMPEQEY